MSSGILQPGDIIPQALSFENFELQLFGTNVLKFSSFDFEFQSEFSVNIGKGGEGVSWSIKSYKRTAKATLYIDEMRKLITLASAYGGDILKLPPAPIVASCGVPDVGVFTLTIPAAKIIKGNYSFKQGQDKNDSQVDFGIVSYPVITFA